MKENARARRCPSAPRCPDPHGPMAKRGGDLPPGLDKQLRRNGLVGDFALKS